jgi:hypothetical protein
MLEQRYWREKKVRRGGKGRIEEVVVVKEEGRRRELRFIKASKSFLFTAMGNGVAAPQGARVD